MATETKDARLQLGFSTWRRLWADLYWVYDDRVRPEDRDMVTAPNWFSAWFIRKGSVVVENDRRVLRGRAGQWVFPASGLRHQVFSPDARILSISFHAVWPSQRDLWQSGTELVLPESRAPALEPAAMRLLRSLPKRKTTVFRVMSQPVNFGQYAKVLRCFYEWLDCYVDALCDAGCVLQSATGADERVDLAISLINSHAFSDAFREDEVARRAGLSVRQLSRLFQEALHMSPSRYFERRRLDRACQMLTSVQCPVKAVSYELGFSSLAYFSNWFKKRKGLSPKRYRARALSEPHPGAVVRRDLR